MKKSSAKTTTKAKAQSAKPAPTKSAPAKSAAALKLAKQASAKSVSTNLQKTSSPKSNPKAQAKTVARTQTLKKPAEKQALPPQKASKKAVTPVGAKPIVGKAAVAKVAAAAPIVAPKVVVKLTTAHKPVAPAAAVRAMPTVASKPEHTKLTHPAVAPKAAAATPPAVPAAAAAPKKPVSSRHGFRTNESIVYPAHGVGRIIGIEEQEIAGMTLELFVIQFEKDKMTLRVPTSKLASVGMRKLAEDDIVKKAMETLKGKARIKRTMWSRRAQEYEAKINSGDLVSIAEVVRDLYRSEAQPEQSYSERQLYEAALDRMAREIAAVDKVDERGAMQRITEVLSKSARGRRAAEEETQADAEVKAA
jgi:CarD family transcriptional regulator